MGHNAMGIGSLNSPTVTFIRKFRWTIEILDPATGNTIVEPHFVKVVSRPTLNIEETELDFLNNKTWIPGKSNWEDITVTYYDVNDNLDSFWTYVTSQYNESSKADYILNLYDGCGVPMESWKLSNGFIKAINFSELDFSSSECVTIEMSVCYDKIEYKNHTTGAPPYELPYGGVVAKKEKEWKIPDEWIIKNPIMESVSPGEQILDQFLRRTASK